MAARKRGRPTKYDPAQMLPVVTAMAKLGAIELEIAQALRVSLGTIELWARTHPEFLRALKPPKRVADDRVEGSLYQRANGYTFDSEEIIPYDHKEVKITQDKDGKPIEQLIVSEKRVLRVPIVKKVPADTTAAIFWLKNRRKHRWRDFKATEISTPPGKPFEVTHAGPGEAELIGAYFARLARAGEAPAAGSAARARSDPHPGVDPGGQGPEGPGGDSETREE